MPLQAAFNFAHFSIKVHSVVTTNFRESKEKRNRFNPIIEVHSIVTGKHSALEHFRLCFNPLTEVQLIVTW